MDNLDTAIKKLEEDLEWRGPGGKCMGVVTLPRELAQALLKQVRRKSLFEDIRDFHEKFGLDYHGPARFLSDDLSDFRSRFMLEEYSEYCGKSMPEYPTADPYFPGLADKFDALVDLVYVAIGTAYMHGFDFDEGWRRVHAANMQKVRASEDGGDSKRGSSLDVVKPRGWQAPDLSDLVRP